MLRQPDRQIEIDEDDNDLRADDLPVGPSRDRVRILLRQENVLEADINDRIILALGGCDIYAWGGQLCRIVHDPAIRRHVIQVIPRSSLREEIDRVCEFRQIKGKGEERTEVVVPPPDHVVAAILDRGSWLGISQLAGIVTHPMLRPDGTSIDTDGYDEATGLFIDSGLSVDVPENPDWGQALAAQSELLGLLHDFEFAEPAGRSALLAATLTPLLRNCFRGAVPMVLADANCRGAGKGLMLAIPGILLSGNDFQTSILSRDDSETRKVITSAVMAGQRLLYFDNIDGRIGGGALEAAITSIGTVWSDRILGQNRMTSMPMDLMFFGSGNNCALTEDMVRRVLRIRLNTASENPEDRDKFRIPELRQYLRDHRSRLLSCCLTMCRAWFVAGRPTQPQPSWGSFEGWSGVVRQIIVWCGLPDPALTRIAVREGGDGHVQALARLLEVLSELDPDGAGLSSKQLLSIAWPQDQMDGMAGEGAERLRDALEELMDGVGGKSPGSKKLGKLLERHQMRPAGGRQLERGPKDRSNVIRWRSVRIPS